MTSKYDYSTYNYDIRGYHLQDRLEPIEIRERNENGEKRSTPLNETNV